MLIRTCCLSQSDNSPRRTLAQQNQRIYHKYKTFIAKIIGVDESVIFQHVALDPFLSNSLPCTVHTGSINIFPSLKKRSNIGIRINIYTSKLNYTRTNKIDVFGLCV